MVEIGPDRINYIQLLYTIISNEELAGMHQHTADYGVGRQEGDWYYYV